jgi:hypothetical protein
MDWSHDLLSEDERIALRRLSVFAGGWTLEAAETVCAGEGIEEGEILDLLASLVDKSLVLVTEQRDGGRATECWRLSGSTLERNSKGAAKRRRCKAGMPRGFWRWPRRPDR